MKFYRLREEDKKFLWALLSGTGVILFWRGIWEVSYEIPLIENVYFVLFVGLFILTITGLIYREFDVFGQKIYKLGRRLHDVKTEAKRGKKYTVHFYDNIKEDEHKLDGKQIHDVETEFIIVNKKGHEEFIPLRRITKITHKGKSVWRK